MRQSEFKMKLDPELGRYTRQHILAAAATKTGEHVGKKAGDKIVQMLSKSNNKPKVTFNKNVETIPSEKELNQSLINLLSGGSTRKRKLYNY